MSVYVTLQSNTFVRKFPDNIPTQFSNKLPQTLEVNGQYEVGLGEIHFPNSYCNVLGEFITIHQIPRKMASTKRHH